MKKGKLHYGFIVALATGIMVFPNCFVFSTGGLFYTPVCEEFGISTTAIGLASTILLGTLALVLPIMNYLFNKYDTKIILTLAVCLMAGGWIVRAVSTNIWYFYVSAVMQAFGFGWISNLAGSILANNWFKKNVGMIISMQALIPALGTLVMGPVGGLIIQTYGWRVCYWVWAAIVLVTGLPMTLFVIKKKPEDMGLLPYGYEEVQSETNVAATYKRTGLDMVKALKTPAFWAVGFAIGTFATATTYNSYIPGYSTEVLGVSLVTAGIMTSCISIGSMGGKFFLGVILDKNASVGNVVTTAIGLVSILGMIVFSKSVFMIGLFCVLFGITYGALNVSFAAFVRDLFGEKDYSKIWPNIVIFISIFGAIAHSLFAIFIDLFGQAKAPYVSVTCFVISIGLQLVAIFNAKKHRAEWTTEE